MRRLLVTALGLAAVLMSASACANPPRREMVVTATAYNSDPKQTQGHPWIAAWGDRLKPGMKAIAVSRDLIPLGLRHRVPVKIEGFPGEYLVLDKMHKRWKKRIDIYMGADIKRAKQFGKRKVVISWPVPEE